MKRTKIFIALLSLFCLIAQMTEANTQNAPPDTVKQKPIYLGIGKENFKNTGIFFAAAGTMSPVNIDNSAQTDAEKELMDYLKLLGVTAFKLPEAAEYETEDKNMFFMASFEVCCIKPQISPGEYAKRMNGYLSSFKRKQAKTGAFDLDDIMDGGSEVWTLEHGGNTFKVTLAVKNNLWIITLSDTNNLEE